MPARAAIRFLLLAALSGAFLAVAPALAAQEPAAAGQSRYLLLIGGKRAGTQTESTWLEADGSVRTLIAARLAVNRFSRTFAVTQTQSWLEQEVLRAVDAEADLNGTKERVTARVEAAGVRIIHERSGLTREVVLPLAEPLLGPHGLAERLRAAWTAREPEFSVEQFLPETGTVATLLLRLRGTGELTDSLGRPHRGWRVDQESSALPGVTTASVYTAQGELEYSVACAGVSLEQVRVGREAARTAGAPEPAAEAAELELFDVASLAIPVRWAAGGRDLRALSAVTVRLTGAALPELERALHSASADLRGQVYTLERDGAAVLLTLRAPMAPPVWPHGAAAGGDFTGDGFYLDLADPRLSDLLARCSPPAFACLERLVQGAIPTKSLAFGFAGVSEVLDTRAGDCTEHALLLTALLRKAGLPARIAYGFLLNESGFVGHAWTEVRSADRWFWLDPSFPGGQPYCFKLRLGVIDPALPVWSQLGVSLLAAAGGIQADVLEAARAR